MTNRERRHVREILMLKETCYLTECTDGFRIFDQRVLGVDYRVVTSLEEVIKIYPHLEEELTNVS